MWGHVLSEDLRAGAEEVSTERHRREVCELRDFARQEGEGVVVHVDAHEVHEEVREPHHLQATT